mmetsp:Transcript_130/g.244  ORF Transcript_130/g.244 Transcript_130/m.244 type:complete len:630 (-) Transcript_130:235-2124(-)|eukprot:CAMPEP_0196813928 /NCGR_PEP_ID=MMETSP1362-20130617/40186_1 /TAXON_ID=163516 /ORGANISM="Leptocylindrus danicus, Strain CCMP1856" /LENGTH=629 /DNA_ID=CAMNT_0042190367 /DNA_START=51 /DNA_END=1940 /DNA_ORIENTATION=-
MGEEVQAILDGYVPYLRDYIERQIFSEPEIKAIVSRRRDSEYLLKRREARKSDFLRYAETETKLEHLRKLRWERIVRETNPKKKGGIGDGHIINNVHFIFRRAVKKWRGDLELVMQHIQFCKETESNQMLGVVYADALKIHPRNVPLWIDAASHEYFGGVLNGSIKSARVLLQRALRINGRSIELWVQYAALEWHYATKLRGRRDLLKIGFVSNNNAEENEADEYGVQGLIDGGVPRFIFKKAIEKMPESLELRLGFLDLCSQFPGTVKATEEILTSIETDFGDNEDAWIARASHVLHAGTTNGNDDLVDKDNDDSFDGTSLLAKNIVSALDVLDEASRRLPHSSKLILHNSKFMEKIFVEECLGDDNDDVSQTLQKRIERLYERAKDNLDATMYEAYSDFLAFRCGNLSKACELLEGATADEKCRDIASLWVKRSKMEQMRQDHDDSTSDVPMSILRCAAKAIPSTKEGHISILLATLDLALTRPRPESRHDCHSLFSRIMLLLLNNLSGSKGTNSNSDANMEQLGDLCCRYLKYSLVKGVDEGRSTYKYIMKSLAGYESVGMYEKKEMRSFFDLCLEIERLVGGSGHSKKGKTIKRKRKIYESAIKFHGDALAGEYRKRMKSELEMN